MIKTENSLDVASTVIINYQNNYEQPQKHALLPQYKQIIQ